MLKYYPSNSGLFQERILRYASTVPCPPGSHIVFDNHSIKKSPQGFEFVPVLEYVVDVYLQQSIKELIKASPFVLEARPSTRVPAREAMLR